MPKKRNKRDIVKNKTYDGIDTRVGMNYMPPAAWKNLTNGDEESELPVLDESLLRQLISEIIKNVATSGVFTRSAKTIRQEKDVVLVPTLLRQRHNVRSARSNTTEVDV